MPKHQTDPSVLCPHLIGKGLEHSPWNTADVENQDSCIWFLNQTGELRRQGLLLSPSWTGLPHPPPTHKGNSLEDHRALKTQQEGQRPRHFLSKAKGSMDRKGAGLLQSLSRIWRREASYLAAMRKDDHHKAVQGTVVTVGHLHQSRDHFLQGKATVKAGAPMETCPAGSSQRSQHSTPLPVLKLGQTWCQHTAPFGRKGTMLSHWPFNPHDNSVGTITLAPKLGNRGIRGQVAGIKKASPQAPFYPPPHLMLEPAAVSPLWTQRLLWGPSLGGQRFYLGSQVVLHLHHEAQPAEAALKLLTVHAGAGACAEPRGRAEVHIVDNEAVATGIRIQGIGLGGNRFPVSLVHLSGEAGTPGSHLSGQVWRASTHHGSPFPWREQCGPHPTCQ